MAEYMACHWNHLIGESYGQENKTREKTHFCKSLWILAVTKWITGVTKYLYILNIFSGIWIKMLTLLPNRILKRDSMKNEDEVDKTESTI